MEAKYYYKGMSLFEYCEESGLSYFTIASRIQKIKKENPNLSVDEVIENAINYDTRVGRKSIYNYHGKSLSQYCEESGLSYFTIASRIQKIKKENPNLSVDEVIENAINYDTKVGRKSIYNHCGKPLSEYCKENGLLYATIIKRIQVIQKENPNLSVDEVVENAINYEKSNIKYYYKNMPLLEWCNENKLNYYTIRNRIMIILKESPNISINEAIEKAINFDIKQWKRSIYNYQGKSLSDYCELHGIKYNTAYIRLQKTKEKYNYISEDDLIEIALKLKTIEDVLNNNMNNFLDSNGINYSLNASSAQEFLREYFDSYFNDNNSIKNTKENKVKRLVYEYKNNNKGQQ